MLKHRCILFTLIILLITNLAVILNIQFLREFSVFLVLTFVPGYLLLKILDIKGIDFWEKIVLTVGISISIIFFLGLFSNYFFMIFSAKPLTIINILLSFDLLIAIFLIILINRQSKKETFYHNRLSCILTKLNSYDKFALILSITIFSLSILGSNIVITSYNIINIIVMIMISGLIIYLVIFHKKINNNLFPFAILSISISILLAYSLFSPYMYGSDSNNEFHFFKLLLYNSKWAIFENSILDSSISISILPGMYQILSNLDPNYMFKLSFIIPLSLNPLVIYLITREYIKNDIFAFLAATFIISQSTFFSQIAAYRNYVAIFFFALLIMIIVKDKIDFKWVSLYILFLFSAIVSHYSTAYMLFAIFFSSFIILHLIYSFFNFTRKDKGNPKNFLENNYLTFGIIILSFGFIFLWHGQLTGQSFNNGLYVISRTISNLINFSFMDSNSPIIAASGGTLKNVPLSTYINFLVYWLSIVFIIIGVIVCLIRYFKNHNQSNMKLNFLSLTIASIFIFVIMLVLPSIFKSLSPSRVYSQILVILACFFVLGGTILTKSMRIKKPHLIILLIVMASFSANSGLISQYTGDMSSVLFNSPQEIDDIYYIYDTEAYSAKWFGNYHIKTNIYADTTASYRLISNGMIPFSEINRLSLMNSNTLRKGYLYLDYSNIIQNKYNYWSSTWELYNMSEFYYKYENKSLIYSSGESEIWYS